MADRDGNKLAKDYGIGIPAPAQTFHVKGLGHADWGMQTRLSHIFQDDGRTIMLAFDHGYGIDSETGYIDVSKLAITTTSSITNRNSLKVGMAESRIFTSLTCTSGMTTVAPRIFSRLR